jgi:ribonuclease VapC
MYVDASVILSILLREEDAEHLAARIEDATTRLCTSPVSLIEAVINLARITRIPIDAAQDIVEQFLGTCQIANLPITPEIGTRAIAAYALYGKGGGSKARLNMGDVFAYACAACYGVPLLYKGKDFVHTDLG